MRMLGLCFLLIFMQACQAEESSEGMAAAESWRTRVIGEAVQVSLPNGWKATQQKNSGKILISDDTGIRIVIWPVFISGALTAAASATICEQLSRNELAHWQWQPAMLVARNQVVMEGQVNGRFARAQMVWFPGQRGTLAFYSVLHGPHEQLQQQRETLSRILASVRLRPPHTQKRPARRQQIRWVRWQEPSEAAYWLQVPQGWRVQGGMYRYSPIDVRSDVRITSPDQSIQIFIGDQNLPYFSIPNWIHQMNGQGEGSWYQIYGNRLMIRRYRPAPVFLQEYLPQRFGRYLSRFQMLRVNNRQDLAARILVMQQQMNMMGLYQQQDFGDAFFRGYNQGQVYVGYCIAGTSLLNMPMWGGDSGIWQVNTLFGFVAREDRVDEATRILSHMVQTLQVNPQWYQMQHNTTANVSQITAETNRAISSIITQSYNATQRVQDNAARQFSNYLRGVVDVRDPQTQMSYKVQSGSNYYWIDALQNIVGTDLYENPDVLRFRQMVEY